MLNARLSRDKKFAYSRTINIVQTRRSEERCESLPTHNNYTRIGRVVHALNKQSFAF